MPETPLTLLIIINTVALVVMAYDKKIAGSGKMRIPEKFFFTIAALGGSPGVLLGMHWFRHKTKKASFQIVIAVILVVQVFMFKFIEI